MEVIIWCSVIVLCTLNGGVYGQIGFPENIIDSTIKNNRQPIYAPTKCPENELFYPGDQKSDWICDCRPAYLFHPLTDKCHAAYRQGPCSQREYLLLPAGSVIPKCAANPCLHDGYVPWMQKCVRLDSSEQCPTQAGRSLRLGVNAATLALECQAVEISSRFGEDDRDQTNALPGSRRGINGTFSAP